jgi:hypothetical protein
MKLPRYLASLLALAGATSLHAHHSYAPFDRTREITLHGTVRTWEMGNPHGYLWLYVKNQRGRQEIWGMEAPSPAVLIRNGWSKYSVKVGDQVTVTLNPLRDGRNGGNLTSITFSDGRHLDTTPGDVRPPAVPHTVSPAPREYAK